MKNYKHLTEEQRYEIERLLSLSTPKSKIAYLLGVSSSTIYREVTRNSDQRSSQYSAKLAESKCRNRHKSKHKNRYFTADIQLKVDQLITQDYSPEQVVGYLKRIEEATVSHERIYQYIWLDKKSGGALYKHLRNRGKRYRKRGSLKDARGIIRNRVDIDHRPKVVDKKERIGDLEVDTIIGKDHKGAIVTINDRATGMLKMSLVSSKDAKAVAQVITKELDEWSPFIHTMTADNGREFAKHEMITQELGIDFYFAKPYHSWQRGANENLNGLIRQYFPKKTDFSTINQYDIKQVEKILNNRPRKRFNFLSPLEKFDQKINQNKISHL